MSARRVRLTLKNTKIHSLLKFQANACIVILRLRVPRDGHRLTLRASPMRRAILLEIDRLHRGLRQTSKLSRESREKKFEPRYYSYFHAIFAQAFLSFLWQRLQLLTSRLVNALYMGLQFELAG